jgi:hypothetical protein
VINTELLTMSEREERDRSSSREIDRVMRDFSLGDVSLDQWSREFLIVVVGVNTELYAELESKLRYDWEPSRPLEFVSTPDFRMRRGVREPYNRLLERDP